MLILILQDEIKLLAKAKSVRGRDDIGNYFPGTGNAGVNRTCGVSSLMEQEQGSNSSKSMVLIKYLVCTRPVEDIISKHHNHSTSEAVLPPLHRRG